MTRRIAAAFGFLGVAFGAFGAHALQGVLTALGTTAIWEKAVLYHLVHALAMLWAADRRAPFRCFAAGITLFSGSLYLYAATKALWLVALTPLGGLCFLAGWLWLVVAKD